ncbi:MAG TPA: hypothetical protein VNX67_02815 [Solirubrobacteraceae bacterium]|jgi:hypothetical protein|nr:hypothetical protein [Solirubrobacteraceae bacterium]
MASIPLRPQYGPTLGSLLAPRWRAAAPAWRALAIAVGVALLALALGLALNLLDASYSRGGPVPFSFRYKGLYRTAPGPGSYVRIARNSHGRLEDSYAVAPLRLGAYSGAVSGELPVFADGYTHTLARRFADFRFEGEGKTRISSTLGGYEVLYRASIEGRTMHGRDVMLLPEHPGARQGVAIEMLTGEPVTVSKPVASSGVLEVPLKSFSFG